MSVHRHLTAASFHRALAKETRDTDRKWHKLYRRCVEHVELSIRYGSAVTGAPGQPVRTGALINSWYRTGSLRKQNSGFVSILPYAHLIENNPTGMTLRSKVGGFHSVKITFHNFSSILQYELELL